MEAITLNLPQPYIKDLDQLVKAGRYPNRSEAIRLAIRDLLKTEAWYAREAVIARNKK